MTNANKMKEGGFVAGVDIGGTNTVFGLVAANGSIIKRGEFKTASQPVFADYVARIASEISAMSDATGHRLNGVGIGAPNANYFTGTIDSPANLIWKGSLQLREEMHRLTGLKTVVTNDANAAAMGEMIFGAARGMKNFIMLTLGTGVGSGIVVDGRVLYGHTGLAGELGHVIVTENGRKCGCGRYGCLEAYASATGIVRTARELLAEPGCRSSLNRVAGGPLNSWIIANHAREGDGVALKAFDITARYLAIAISNAVLFSSPEAIILAGGLARAGDLLNKPLLKYVDEMILNAFRGSFTISGTALPESDAAVLGAAALVAGD